MTSDRRKTLAAVLLLLVARSASAEDLQDDAEIEEITTTATRDELTPRILPDLLRGEPGIFVQQTTPGQGIPIVRGLIGSAVLSLVDGMRLNNAIFRPAP